MNLFINFIINWKKLFCKVVLKRFSKLKLFILFSLSKRGYQQIFIVSFSKPVLVKRDSKSKVAMNNPKFSLANAKLFLMVNLLVLIVCKIETKRFAKSYEGVLMADKIGRKGGQLSMSGSYEFYKDCITCQVWEILCFSFLNSISKISW